jgi:hypothetical protein
VATSAELLALGHEQDAVEVVADVVHRHRERDLAQQVFERLLRHAEDGAEVGRLLHQREVFRRQGLQRELALAALQDELGLRRFQADRLVRRHGAQDVDQLARTHRGGEAAAVAIELRGGADLDFEVAGGQLHAGAGLANQHVGQHRQRVAPLHDAADRLQRRQHFVLCCFQDDHVYLLSSLFLNSNGRASGEPPAPARHPALSPFSCSACLTVNP